MSKTPKTDPVKWVCNLRDHHSGMGTYGLGATQADALEDATTNFRKQFGKKAKPGRPTYEEAAS